jgi:hypothetical protein
MASSFCIKCDHPRLRSADDPEQRGPESLPNSKETFDQFIAMVNGDRRFQSNPCAFGHAPLARGRSPPDTTCRSFSIAAAPVTPRLGKMPPSRAGRRQVICFVEADTLGLVKASARARGETLQQALARAVNEELAAMGATARLTCERRRLFTRVQKAAQSRGGADTAAARKGRKAIAGWFDRNEVAAVADFAAEVGVGLQQIAAAGLARTAAKERRAATRRQPGAEAGAPPQPRADGEGPPQQGPASPPE